MNYRPVNVRLFADNGTKIDAQNRRYDEEKTQRKLDPFIVNSFQLKRLFYRGKTTDDPIIYLSFTGFSLVKVKDFVSESELVRIESLIDFLNSLLIFFY